MVLGSLRVPPSGAPRLAVGLAVVSSQFRPQWLRQVGSGFHSLSDLSEGLAGILLVSGLLDRFQRARLSPLFSLCPVFDAGSLCWVRPVRLPFSVRPLRFPSLRRCLLFYRPGIGVQFLTYHIFWSSGPFWVLTKQFPHFSRAHVIRAWSSCLTFVLLAPLAEVLLPAFWESWNLWLNFS